MQVRCPQCRSSVEVRNETALTDVDCPTCGSRFSLISGDPTDTLPTTARQIAHFELIREVGRGQFGSVWLAHDANLERRVAIKIPRRGALDVAETALFLRDARTAAQLKHPSIARVHEVGRDGDTVYIVSDFIDGANLKEWSAVRRPSSREAATLLAKLADAVAFAHSAGVVHRDLKPGNVMIDLDGEPHLIDFGLAKRTAGDATMAAEGHILGTPAYMSPEQARGKAHEADGRTDVYSLGVILFELLTGTQPFRGQNQMLLLQIQRDEPPRLRSLDSQIPRDLETITLKCLEKEPAQRYQSAQELSADLRRYLAGQVITARPVGVIGRAGRWVRRNPVVASLAAVAALALIMTSVVSSIAYERTRRALVGESLAHQEAEHRRAVAQQALESEERQRAEAQRQRTLADENFQRARRAVDDSMTSISENRLLDEPGLQPLRRELVEQSLRYYEEFLKDRDDDPQTRAEVASAYLRLSQLQTSLGNTDDALASLGKGIRLVEQALADGADARQVASWVGGVFRGPRYNRRNESPPTNPLTTFLLLSKGTAIWERLVAQAPDVPGLRQDLSGFYYYVGMANWILRKRPDAIAMMEKSQQLLQGLVAELPERVMYRSEWAIVTGTLAEMHEESSAPDKAAAIYDAALSRFPDSVELCNRAARFWANCRDPKLRRLEQARQLAEHATRLAPRDAEAWNTLGLAYYRGSQWAQAVEAIQTGIDLRNGGDAWDWFYMAMALWQLNRAEEARQWYARGASWAQTPRHLRQIQRLYDEASALIGETGTSGVP